MADCKRCKNLERNLTTAGRRISELGRLSKSLLANVRGLNAFESEIREVAGNSNWSAIQYWVSELRAALTPPAESKECSFCGTVNNAHHSAECVDHPHDGEHGCAECGLSYGDEHGFPDLCIPNQWWRRISPTGDSCGVLCPCCIIRRLEAWLKTHGIVQRMHISCAFSSGPLRTVSPELMGTIRWAENFRERESGRPHDEEEPEVNND